MRVKNSDPTHAAMPPGTPRPFDIFVVRGRRVILDFDLAALYDVPTKRLNEQVRRNPGRFPQDFAFQLSKDEWKALRSQIATLKTGRGTHRKFLPHAFTEYGALMAAGVLNSGQAIEVSIHIVRTFVAMRESLAHTGELTRRMEDLERRLGSRLDKNDEAIAQILKALRALMSPVDSPQRTIGFVTCNS